MSSYLRYRTPGTYQVESPPGVYAFFGSPCVCGSVDLRHVRPGEAVVANAGDVTVFIAGVEQPEAVHIPCLIPPPWWRRLLLFLGLWSPRCEHVGEMR